MFPILMWYSGEMDFCSKDLFRNTVVNLVMVKSLQTWPSHFQRDALYWQEQTNQTDANKIQIHLILYIYKLASYSKNKNILNIDILDYILKLCLIFIDLCLYKLKFIREKRVRKLYKKIIKMAKHHPDLIMCRKQTGVSIGRLCDKCDGKCVICDSYFRPTTLVRICD